MSQNRKEDYVQELILRHFSLISCQDTSLFGKPSMAEQGLETMKKLNKEMESWEASKSATKVSELKDPLLQALDFAVKLFDELVDSALW